MIEINVFTMVVLIVFMSLTAGVINKWLKTKRTSKELVKRIEVLEDQVLVGSDLETRVQALEAIATDEKRHLDREIRAL